MIIYLSLSIIIITIMTIVASLFIPEVFLKNYLAATNNSFAASATVLSATMNNIDLSVSTLINSKEGEFYTLLSKKSDDYKERVENFTAAKNLFQNTFSMAVTDSRTWYRAVFFVDKEMELYDTCSDYIRYLSLGVSAGSAVFLSNSDSVVEYDWYRNAKWNEFYWFADETNGLLCGVKQYIVSTLDATQTRVTMEDVGVLYVMLDPSVLVEQIRACNNGTQNAVVTFRFSDSDLQIGSLAERTSYYTYETNLISGVDLIVQIPKWDMNKISFTYIFYLILLAAGIILGVLIVVRYISGSLTRPIVALSGHMKRTQVLTPISTGELPDNEIKEIYNSYNELLVRIADLIVEKENEVEKRKEQEFVTYQLQINPHFIYNTLNTLSCSLMLRGQNDMVEALKTLSDYLRYNYSNPWEEVAIVEEVRQLENYIQIQNLKYGGRIILKTEIPEAHKNYRINKMLLQPLVENAINYELGLYDEGPMTVRVCSTRSEDTLSLCVANDVVCEDVDKINDHIAGKINISRHSGGLGTRNINDRLRLKYGDGYGLTYYVTDTETVACLTIPALL